MKYFFFLGVVTFAFGASAALSPSMTVQGYIRSFNEKTVKIYSHGNDISVPRSAFPKKFKLTTGNLVTVSLDEAEMSPGGRK